MIQVALSVMPTQYGFFHSSVCTFCRSFTSDTHKITTPRTKMEPSWYLGPEDSLVRTAGEVEEAVGGTEVPGLSCIIISLAVPQRGI